MIASSYVWGEERGKGKTGRKGRRKRLWESKSARARFKCRGSIRWGVIKTHGVLGTVLKGGRITGKGKELREEGRGSDDSLVTLSQMAVSTHSIHSHPHPHPTSTSTSPGGDSIPFRMSTFFRCATDGPCAWDVSSSFHHFIAGNGEIDEICEIS